MSSEIGPSWLNFWNAGPAGAAGSTGTTGSTGAPGPAPEGQSASYYANANQSLTSGLTTINYQSDVASNTPGFITRTSSSTWTVQTRGVYQLEAHVQVQPNGSTWTILLKGVQIVVNRGTNQVVLENNSNIQSGIVYTQQCVGVVGLEVGDVISIQVSNSFTGGPAFIVPISTDFDLNSFFTWSLIKTF